MNVYLGFFIGVCRFAVLRIFGLFYLMNNGGYLQVGPIILLIY